MRTVKERRRKKRWQVAVLVRCSIPKVSDQLFDLEMWAKDINEKGMKLECTRDLTVSQMYKDGQQHKTKAIRFDDIEFSKGIQIKVQDLFYDDDGSPFIEGKLLWARKGSSGDSWQLGLEFADSKKQSKALLGAFKDFLSVVKNPTNAIRKSTRKK